MKTLDPKLKALLQVAVGVYGGPLAATAFELASSTADRMIAKHGDKIETMTREEIETEIVRINAEELPDVGERPPGDGE